MSASEVVEFNQIFERLITPNSNGLSSAIPWISLVTNCQEPVHRINKAMGGLGKPIVQFTSVIIFHYDMIIEKSDHSSLYMIYIYVLYPLLLTVDIMIASPHDIVQGDMARIQFVSSARYSPQVIAGILWMFILPKFGISWVLTHP